MIAALIAKDLRFVARDRIFRFVFAGFVFIYLSASLIFLSSFLASGNYPFDARSSILFSRLSVFQGILLAAFVPWIILRMDDQELREPGSFSAATLATPFQVILSKLIASAICLVNIGVLPLPVLCVARLFGAATLRQVLWVLADTFIFLMVLALVVFHVRLYFRSWLSCWISSYAAFGLTCYAWYKVWSSAGRQSCSLLFVLLLVFFAALLFAHGNRVLLYERN